MLSPAVQVDLERTLIRNSTKSFFHFYFNGRLKSRKYGHPTQSTLLIVSAHKCLCEPDTYCDFWMNSSTSRQRKIITYTSLFPKNKKRVGAVSGGGRVDNGCKHNDQSVATQISFLKNIVMGVCTFECAGSLNVCTFECARSVLI